MNDVRNPIVSEFSTDAEADQYDQWFRAKVEASLAKADDPATPRFSSDEVVRRVDAAIRSTQARNASGRLA